MPETITWTIYLDVTDGPKLPLANSLEVDAYDKLEIPLDAGAADIDVQVQPGGAGQVRLLVVNPAPADPDITCSADAGATTITLDAPLVLIGSGAVGLLANPPQTLRFANGTANPATVEILVGRDAIP